MAATSPSVLGLEETYVLRCGFFETCDRDMDTVQLRPDNEVIIRTQTFFRPGKYSKNCCKISRVYVKFGNRMWRGKKE